jgi:hypothetical protein
MLSAAGLTFSLLIIDCLFDPAGNILGIKLYLFIACFLLYAMVRLVESDQFQIEAGLVFYVLLFSFVLPLASILYLHTFGNTNRGDQSFEYLKSFLFLSLVFVLPRRSLDTRALFAWCLTLEATVILAVGIIVRLYPDAYTALYSFGDASGMFSLATSEYGEVAYLRTYFHTSPLLVFSISYFAYRFWKTEVNRPVHFALLVINLGGIILSGSRNNMIVGMALFIGLAVVYSSGWGRKVAVLAALAGVIFLIGNETLHRMLSVEERSNVWRLALYDDYIEVLSDPRSLLLGQGLGSFFDSLWRGSVSNSELTYFELIRRFGIILGMFYLAMIFYPVFVLVQRERWRWLGLAYLAYLMMIFFNPFFFSSSGMILLTVVLLPAFSRDRGDVVPRKCFRLGSAVMRAAM